MDEIFLRMAQEPLFIEPSPGSCQRTHARWVTLSVKDSLYQVNSGNDRGSLHNDSFEDWCEAENKFEEIKSYCNMEEDDRKTVWDENKKVTLEQMLRCYFSEGGYLCPCMDLVLEQLKRDLSLRYSYRNICRMIAHVKLSKKNHGKAEVFVEKNIGGEMVLEIRAR